MFDTTFACCMAFGGFGLGMAFACWLLEKLEG